MAIPTNIDLQDELSAYGDHVPVLIDVASVLRAVAADHPALFSAVERVMRDVDADALVARLVLNDRAVNGEVTVLIEAE